jgi:hypothetical protein
MAVAVLTALHWEVYSETCEIRSPLGQVKRVPYSKVSSFQDAICTENSSLGPDEVSLFHKMSSFRRVAIHRFYCTTYNPSSMFPSGYCTIQNLDVPVFLMILNSHCFHLLTRPFWYKWTFWNMHTWGWDLVEWSERCASIPKVTGSNPSGGSELTFCSDLLLTARGGCTRALIEFACPPCYPGNTLCSQSLEPPGGLGRRYT